MVFALGFSNNSFQPTRPGRLCRGRERWIQAWPTETAPVIYRTVMSGAAFSDDSARDALRGLNQSGVDMGALVRALFPEQHLLAFKEQGELAVVPPSVQNDQDTFTVPRRGGAYYEGCQRWRMSVQSAESIQDLLLAENVDGFVVLDKPELTPALDEALYLLSGMGDESVLPVQRFQPLGILEVLEHSQALIAVHLDKHGPAIAVYSMHPLDFDALLVETATQAGALAVPFAIPPMLARWDRALHELRMNWSPQSGEEFPVPPADEPTRWSQQGPGWRRGRGPAAAIEE